MKDINKIILVGRLGNDPVKRETKTGLSVANFSLATSKWNPSQAAEDGEKEQETQWHHVVTWGKEADNCAQYIKKGETVYVEGSVRTRQYVGKDGHSRTAFEVHAERVRFMGGGKRRKTHDEAPSEELMAAQA